MIGRTNAARASAGGAFAGPNDAVLRVTVPAGSTATLSRGGVTRQGDGWEPVGESGSVAFLFAIYAAELSAEPWTVSATDGSGAATASIVIDSNKLYSLSISYRLPTAYQEVAYLESSGAQHVDTGISASSIGRCRIVGRILDSTSYTALCGACASTSAIDNQKTLAYRPADGYFYLDNNGYLGASAIAANTDFTLDFSVSSSALSVTVNGTTRSSSGTIGAIASDNLWLFANNYHGTHLAGVKARIQEAQLYDRSGNLVADLIPCYRRSDNAAGFWDTERNQFVPGTGTFTLGPAV
jgi:hypothetical protein